MRVSLSQNYLDSHKPKSDGMYDLLGDPIWSWNLVASMRNATIADTISVATDRMVDEETHLVLTLVVNLYLTARKPLIIEPFLSTSFYPAPCIFRSYTLHFTMLDLGEKNKYS